MLRGYVLSGKCCNKKRGVTLNSYDYFNENTDPGLLLRAPVLHAQELRWGLDEMFGIHYNIQDAASYKTPVGDAVFGAHLTLSDPDDPSRPYFNARLAFGIDIQTYALSLNTKMDCGFRDLTGSFQVHKKLNEKLSVYAGINLSVNVVNTIWIRYSGGIFSDDRRRAKEIETIAGEKMRKLNAGIETGFLYPLGKGFSAGMNLSYYILKRLQEDLQTKDLGLAEDVALNFRPLTLKVHCTFDFP